MEMPTGIAALGHSNLRLLILLKFHAHFCFVCQLVKLQKIRLYSFIMDAAVPICHYPIVYYDLF